MYKFCTTKQFETKSKLFLISLFLRLVMDLQNIVNIEVVKWLLDHQNTFSKLPENFRFQVNGILSDNISLGEKKELILKVLAQYSEETRQYNDIMTRDVMIGSLATGVTAYIVHVIVCKYFPNHSKSVTKVTDVIMCISLFVSILFILSYNHINF